jgi:hypothetical protein
VSTPRKIVFLDVDGVLNCVGTKTRNCHGALGLEPILVERVRKILLPADTGYVLSSTWRKYHDLMVEVHVALQPNVRRLGFTGQHPDGGRAEEIQNWLRYFAPFGPVHFVILDDWDLESYFPGHCVVTRDEIGITEADVEKALRILEQPTKLSF